MEGLNNNNTEELDTNSHVTEAAELLLRNQTTNQNDFGNETGKSKESLNVEDISDKVIDNANKYFLVKILSPEITNNEKKKRKHKDKLIGIVKIFLIFQFIILTILLFGIIFAIFVFHGFKNDLELSYVETIIKFVGVYITSVVIELIAMLKFIVSNVFDTSITGLVEIYKDTTIKEQEES